MREQRTYGSVRGAVSNGRPYRDQPDRYLIHRVRYVSAFVVPWI